MIRATRVALLLAAGACATLLAAACSTRQPEPLSDRMMDHFGDAASVQTGLILGDLGRARASARRLASDDEFQSVPSGAEAEVEVVRARAREVASAETVEEAARAASGMAAACGECHAAFAAGPVFSPPSNAPDGGHMVEHLWAADRLWEGLVQPASGRWESGARVLARHGVPMDLVDPETSELGMRLKALGMEALSTSDAGGRASRYAEIIGTCAECHTARRDLPR